MVHNNALDTQTHRVSQGDFLSVGGDMTHQCYDKRSPSLDATPRIISKIERLPKCMLDTKLELIGKLDCTSASTTTTLGFPRVLSYTKHNLLSSPSPIPGGMLVGGYLPFPLVWNPDNTAADLSTHMYINTVYCHSLSGDWEDILTLCTRSNPTCAWRCQYLCQQSTGTLILCYR